MESTNTRPKTPKPKANRSRTGCEKCKSRKLKCGEEKPSCRRCVVGNWKCEYVAPKVWLFEPSCKPANEEKPALVSSEDLCKIPFEHPEPFQCQNSICQSRPRSKKSATQNPCRGPLCFGRLLGPVQVNDAGEKGLNYWINVFAPANILLVTLKDGSNGLLTRVLPWALQNDLILDTIISTSLAYAADGDLSSEYGIGALRFRQSIVNKIVQRLPYGCDHALIQAVICLIFTDMRLGFVEHCRAHFQGLRAMVLSCGGLNSLALDGMQRDIILMFDEVFHIFREGDDPELCNSQPRQSLLSRFTSFAPDIAAQKLGILSLELVFAQLQQQILFPFLHDPLVIWDQPTPPIMPVTDEIGCSASECSPESFQESVEFTQILESIESPLFDEDPLQA